jgi:branched-subunit amino acid aminotransferase/4-amino-4-deoxychorismate lyase
MHRFVSFNNKIFEATDITASPISTAALYGKGIFTTIAIHRGKPFLWEKHWRRLTDNADRIGLDKSQFSEDLVLSSLIDLIQKPDISEARCRVTFFDESQPNLWSIDSSKKTSILITTADTHKVSKLKLAVSPFRINSMSPLVNIKSCNYLENILALENAKKNGFDEAIRLNERGEISSAIMANIFWTNTGKLFTPSLKTGCLAGTIRELIIENREVFEVEQNIADFTFDEIFLTSSGLGIADAYFGETKQSSELSQTFKSISELLDYKKNP